jgi:soluble lytic murein transglycosylase
MAQSGEKNMVKAGRIFGLWGLLAAIPALISPALATPAGDPPPETAQTQAPIQTQALIQTPAPALSERDHKVFPAAFAAARKHQWKTARRLAARGDNRLARKVLDWLALQDEAAGARFHAISRFLGDNPTWPHQRRLRLRAEAVMGRSLSARAVIDWFERYPPLSSMGRLRQAEALLKSGRRKEGLAVLRKSWIEGRFSRAEERRILRRHRRDLTQADQIARLDRALWDSARATSRRALYRVPGDIKSLGAARLALIEHAPGVDAAIARVPPALQSNPGLIYERVRWRRQNGLDDSARALLLRAPDDPRALVRPDKWWRERRIQVRKALAEHDETLAYDLARHHGQGLTQKQTKDGATPTVSAAYARARLAEAEWLAGWIALRFLDEPGRALEHFTRLYQAVRTPVSRARAAYWAGRAAGAGGDETTAQNWFTIAARFPTTFYGQLAPLSRQKLAALPRALPPSPSAQDIAAFNANELVRTARVLAALGQADLLRPFIAALRIAAPGAAMRALAADLAIRLGRPDLAVHGARLARRDGLMLLNAGYPLAPLPPTSLEKALVLAIVRQESGFYPRARSYRGALGMMQLMPFTARATARRIGVPFAASRLTSDANYNLLIGSAHLAELVEAYRGSYVLAIAAYNAGPAAVAHWIRLFGDPRDAEVDTIDWLEMIPYRETRNYVQRVLEALPLYRLRLGQPAGTADLATIMTRAESTPRPVMLPRPRP